MSGVTNLVQQQLTPDTINQISSSIGADPATTQQAVNAALPMMLGGMAAHGTNPAGAQAINAAASEHSGMLDAIGGMLGGGGSGAGAGGLGGILGGLGGMMGGAGQGGSGGLGGLAGGVLGNILGSNHSEVQNGVSKASGLDPQKAGKLLMILAPIVLAALARRKQQTGADDSQIANDLRNEVQTHVETNPDHGGGLIGDFLRKSGAVRKS